MPPLTQSISVALLFVSGPLFAEIAYSPIVGYLNTTIPCQSDINTGTTFMRPPVYVGMIASAVGSTLTVTDDPKWSFGEFTYAGETQPNTYYARITSVEGEDNFYAGRTFTIEVAGSNSLIVTDPVDGPFDSLPSGSRVEIIPYWTLNTLFPQEDVDLSFFETKNQSSLKTQVILRDHNATGINIPFSKSYYFMAGKWRMIGGDPNEDFGNTVIHPQKPFTVRNTELTSLEINQTGHVLLGKTQVQVRSQADSSQDTQLTTGLPVPMKLRDLNLANTTAFRSCTGPFNIKDMLFLYDNETMGFNKSATISYYNVGGIWKKAGSVFSADFGDDLIHPGVSFFIRRDAINDLSPVFWTTKILD